MLISACAKNDISDDFPPTIFTEPVFKIQALLGTDIVDIQAGVDSFYMYTDYNQNADGNILIGRFAAEEGASVAGEEELKFSIRTPLSATHTAEFLSGNDYSYTPPISSGFYQYNFTSTNLNTSFIQPVNYSWSFENTQFSSEANPSYSKDDQSPFQVSLTVLDSINCSANYSGWVSPDINSDSTFLLDLNYATNLNNNTIEFIVQNPNTDVSWNTGSLGDTLIYDMSLMLADTVVIIAQATNQYGKMASASIEIINSFGPSPSVCFTKFDYTTIVIDPIPINLVVIEYQKDGRKYSSDLGDQPSDSFIEINEVEDFEINENGLATFKMKVNFKVRLYNVDTGDFRPFTGSGVIGVAHPN